MLMSASSDSFLPRPLCLLSVEWLYIGASLIFFPKLTFCSFQFAYSLFRLIVMEPLEQEKEMEQLIRKTTALNWDFPPPPSWSDPVGAKEASGAVLIGKIIAMRDFSLHAARTVIKKSLDIC